jgi:hypothetical protein
MRVLKQTLSAVLLTIAAASASASPVFVGSWDLYSGRSWWGGNAPIMSGQMEAASLFGGAADDYFISTNGEDVANINYSAWYDQYGVGPGVHAQDFLVDSGAPGFYDVPGDSSAMIMDNAYGQGLMNYAFRVDAPANVPEPLTLGLMGAGIFGMGMARRRKSVK